MKEVNKLSLVDCVLLSVVLNQLRKFFTFYIEGDLKSMFVKYKTNIFGNYSFAFNSIAFSREACILCSFQSGLSKCEYVFIASFHFY